MARHLHGTHRQGPQTRMQTAARLLHGTRLHGHLIPTPQMVVGLLLGTRPRGRRIPMPNHHGDQVLGGAVRHLHVQRTLVGHLGMRQRRLLQQLLGSCLRRPLLPTQAHLHRQAL